MKRISKKIMDNPYAASAKASLSKSVFDTVNANEWPDSTDDINPRDYLNMQFNNEFMKALGPTGK